MEGLIKALIIAVAAPVILMFGIVAGFAISLIMAWPLLWAWNYAVPAVFGAPALTYWQAFCLLVVANLLVKSSHTTNCK